MNGKMKTFLGLVMPVLTMRVATMFRAIFDDMLSYLLVQAGTVLQIQFCSFSDIMPQCHAFAAILK